MIRAILYLLVSVLLISFLRSVIGLITKAASAALEPDKPPAAGATQQFGGELKKDPVCGTFVSTSTALKKTLRDEVFYFCSPACRDKFTGHS